MTGVSERLDAIEARSNDPFSTAASDIAQVDEDRDYLLDLARKQQAAIDAVKALANAWEARGEHDMKFSKRIDDEDIADMLRTEGAQKVENARHIRNALEGK